MSVFLSRVPVDILREPRAGAVPAAEVALADATAFADNADAAAHLARASAALREAGWLAPARYADALAHGITHAGSQPEAHASFVAAIDELRETLARGNLRELACSPVLFERLRAAVSALFASEDIALAGRLVLPATLAELPEATLAHIRARYEAALLPALKAQPNGSRAASAWTDAVYAELDVCLSELASSQPYDFWRLAAACGRALRRTAPLWGDVECRRFYARCNLVIGEHAHGARRASHAFVRATLALLWRDYALCGAGAGDVVDVELLRDYGLTVSHRDADAGVSDALWEPAAAAQIDVPTRRLGALSVDAHAYEDFLQTADASMPALAGSTRESTAHADAAALLAADAAYRLGTSAWAAGLAHVGMLADALGLAWQRAAHAAAWPSAIPAPDPAALASASETLRAMLYKVAAGVAQPDACSAVDALGRALDPDAAR